jgi:AbrB family looped-hinge helix DNA binding protein
MTFGFVQAMRERHLVRIQEKGQVTLPADVRRSLNLKKGDLVAVETTENGVLITPQEIVATRALDMIGQALRDQGVSLDELMESGREIRGELVAKQYGTKNPTNR